MNWSVPSCSTTTTRSSAACSIRRMNVVLEVELDDDLELDDYVVNFRRMYGDERMDAVLGSVDGSVRFFGLTPTSMKLEGLDRHQRLIDSYKKLHAARAKAAAR